MTAFQQLHYFQGFRRSTNTAFHLRLLENELDGVSTKRIVDGAERELVSIATMLGQNPFEAIGGIHAKNSILHAITQE